jgi:1-phosphofructokinase
VEDRTVAVLAPSVSVTITIETASDDEADDIHIHAGGQGVWVARMLRQLGYRPVVCAPVGGESGRTLLGLTSAWGIDVRKVDTVAETPAYVHDRRGGERRELARSATPTLRRHESDELYQVFLELALAGSRGVVTGPGSDDLLPKGMYRRLGADLASAGVDVIGDLHGHHLAELLEGGPLGALKIARSDLELDGRLPDDLGDGDDDLEPLAAVMDDLHGDGVGWVVVSRGDRPAFARVDDGYRLVSGPPLEVVDPTGSGDSMTAALALGRAEERDPDEVLRTAWAAGAANVSRHGLGSGVPGLIEELARRVEVVPWEPS